MICVVGSPDIERRSWDLEKMERFVWSRLIFLSSENSVVLAVTDKVER